MIDCGKADATRTATEAARQQVLARACPPGETNRQQRSSQRASVLFAALLAGIGVGWLVVAADLALLRAV